MSTEVTTQSGEVVAVRFFGGKDTGVVVQMEVGRKEWAAWANVQVTEDHGFSFCTFQEWVDRQTATVRWDNAARQNEMAREFENHRWAEMFEGMASACRQRARVMARDEMFAVV